MVRSDSDAGVARKAKPSVLIVEDDFVIASDLEHDLIKAGFKVVGIAFSAAEALRMAAMLKPTVAIMDVRLVGERDGVEAALDLFRNHQIRCLFATAYIDGPTQARAAPASPLGWIPKPYSARALIEMLDRALSN